jgi:hypothetical protein
MQVRIARDAVVDDRVLFDIRPLRVAIEPFFRRLMLLRAAAVLVAHRRCKNGHHVAVLATRHFHHCGISLNNEFE